jgi:hypothetical protein
MKKRWLWLAPLILLAFVLFIAVGGEVVRLLWNWLLPTLFGWREITFWQALGLLALCRILFGGFGVNGSRRSSRCRTTGRFEHLTPDERERFRQWLRERGSSDPAPAAE